MVTPLSSSLARCSSHAFDAAIVDAVQREWRDFNEPRFWKAQLCQESALNPKAVSPAGAQGIAQFMPGTWNDVVRSFDWDSAFNSPFNPEKAIRAGARYQGERRRAWSAKGRTSQQRNDLGLCSYNAGMGNCLKAQSFCGGSLLWPTIRECLPAVTGPRNSAETIGYVSNVNCFVPQMRLRP